MPIYEFLCRGCESRFEELVRPGGEAAAQCPECRSGEATRLLSVFAVASSGGGRPQATGVGGGPMGAGCCGGSCGCG